MLLRRKFAFGILQGAGRLPIEHVAMILWQTVAAFTGFVEAYEHAKTLNASHPHRVYPNADGYAVQRKIVWEPAYLAWRKNLLLGVGA
jgi:hypothetical protein